MWLTHLECYGTQVSATITPKASEAETLASAWLVVRALASWLLQNRASHSEKERYAIIVGWSKSVRSMQGQIIKAGGSVSDIQAIIAAETVDELAAAQHRSLRKGWQKDVFDAPRKS